MRFEIRSLHALLTLAALAGAASAQVVMVTTAYDVSDISSSATMADLPGPDGVVSLREALLATDNMPGHQTVGFQIPAERFWLPNIYPEFVLIQGSFGFSANDQVTLDGTTQTAFTGDMNPDGHEVVVELGVSLNADNSEAFGFHGCDIGVGGNNSVVHDNTGAMYIIVGPFNSGNIIRDNEAWTIKIIYSDDNIVVRNVTDRVRITGQGTFGPPASGNRIGGPDPADRNFITGWGNVGEHGSVAGDTVELYYTDDTLIQNNYIGTTPDGMAIGNFASTAGIAVYTANSNLTIRDNLIATQAHWGGGSTGAALGSPIYLNLYEAGNANIRIFGNTLGLNALGEPVLGGAAGITVNRYAFQYGAADVRIGGPNPGEGNVIAGHESTGVLMFNGPGVPPIGHIRLSGNSIYANGEIGIDLMPNTWDFGATPNDSFDADVGANGLQNFPDLARATKRDTGIHVTGALHSEPFKDYTLEFFANPACDASGFGQGEVFLGSTTVLTDAEGQAAFHARLAALAPEGWFVTSTATLEPVGATSEFSACVPLQGVPAHPGRFLRPRVF